MSRPIPHHHLTNVSTTILLILLFITTLPLQTTSLDICGSNFHDPISKSIMAEVVVSGKMMARIESNLSKSDENFAIQFRVDEVIKADDETMESLLYGKLIRIETFSNVVEDPVMCYFKDIEENSSYVMFLKSPKYSNTTNDTPDNNNNNNSNSSSNNNNKSNNNNIIINHYSNNRNYKNIKDYDDDAVGKNRDGINDYDTDYNNPDSTSTRLFILSSFPVLNPDDETSKKIKTGLCRECAKAPTAIISEESNVKEQKWGRSTKLDCNFKGKPTPVVTWLHNDTPIDEDGDLHYRVKSGKSSSRLEINKLINESSGTYTCVVENVLGKSTADIQVAVRPVNFNASTEFSRICPKRLNNCLNNGVCILLLHNFAPTCKCDGIDYQGPRCQIAKGESAVKEKEKSGQSSLKEVMMIISATIVSIILVAVIIGSVYLCKRQHFATTKNQALLRDNPNNNNNISNINNNKNNNINKIYKGNNNRNTTTTNNNNKTAEKQLLNNPPISFA